MEGCSFLPSGMAGYDEELDTTRLPIRRPDASRRTWSGRAGADPGGRGGGREGNRLGLRPVRRQSRRHAGVRRDAQQDRAEASRNWWASAVWRQTIGNAKNRPQTGYRGFTQAFPHPLTFFALVESDAIRPTNNKNTSNISDPLIDSDGQSACSGSRTSSRSTDEWARLNRYLVGGPTSCRTGTGSAGRSSPTGSTSRTAPSSTRSTSRTGRTFCLKEGEG